MSEGYVQAPPDGPGKKLRTIKDTVDGVEVHSEVMSIADPTTVGRMLVIDANGKIGVSSLPTATVADMLRGLVDPPTTKKVNEVNLTLNADGTVATIVFRDAVPAVLFTLTLSYPDATHINIVRS
jgi:hypothetical protein